MKEKVIVQLEDQSLNDTILSFKHRFNLYGLLYNRENRVQYCGRKAFPKSEDGFGKERSLGVRLVF